MSMSVRTVVVCFVYLARSDHFHDDQNLEHLDGAETGKIGLAAAVTPLALNVKDGGLCPCLSTPSVSRPPTWAQTAPCPHHAQAKGKSAFPFWACGTSCQSPTFGKKDADVPSSLGEPETTGAGKGPGWCSVSDAQVWGMLLITELQS